MRIPGWGVGAAWAITLALAWWGYGSFLGLLVEGNNSRLLAEMHRAWWIVPTLALLASLVVTVLWMRRGGAGPAQGLSGRRRFLLGSGTALAGLVGAGVLPFWRNKAWIDVTLEHIFLNEAPTAAERPRAEWQGARVRSYGRLGRTDFRVSDISLGASRIQPERQGEEIVRLAIERGVNYIDTAPDYSNTGSEIAVGRALQGQRDGMFVATKFCTPQGDLPAGSPVAQYMQMVDDSLRRLQTDYVDLVHVHACNSVERLMDPNAHEAFDRLKQQGKVRFMGVSSHTPNLERVAHRAIDSGRFDVLMLAYHHGAWPGLAGIIDKAAANDVGVIAMKTLKGAKHRGLLEDRDEADSYTQAAFKWVLDNPSVSGLVVSFRELANVDEYLYASGGRPTPDDHALLKKYDRLIAGSHCWQHCGACLSSCPEQLAIDDVLRFRMYFEDYRDEKSAMQKYAKLERRADACIGCSAPCTGSCPHGLQIQERMIGAHQMLTLPPLAG